MLNWSKQFSIFLFLDSNDYQSPNSNYECLLAINAVAVINGEDGDQLAKLKKWHDEHKDWLFGHLSYDYKNVLEPGLSSNHSKRFSFPLIYFFCPQVVCYVTKDQHSLVIEAHNADPEEIFRQLQATDGIQQTALPAISFQKRIDEARYLAIVEKLRQHIKDGDCYEINMCSEGFAEHVTIDPLAAFNKLSELSPAPFAAYYRNEEQYLLCASPERYLNKKGNKIIAQPIKGTARRDRDAQKDEANKRQLHNSQKERAENVMIVDLTRNDLARSCSVGSITVEELYGIYTFPQVHQMISTVSGTLSDDKNFTDAIRYSFPMGSMTGAPKYKVMELIELYEHSARELFSGTVGYITPNADFDFNVIIRSIFYNSATNYLSYHTGGAITYDSVPSEEWAEMRLKAWALERVFE